MQPKHCLTKQEKRIIKQYTEAYTSIVDANVDYIVNPWSDNKQTLFKLLGKQLKIEVPLKVEVDIKTQTEQLCYFHRAPFMLYGHFSTTRLLGKSNDFINAFEDYFKELVARKDMEAEDLFAFSALMAPRFLIESKTIGTQHCYTYAKKEGKVLKISPGTKIQRAIQKLLKFYDFPHMNLYEEWRAKISAITTTRTRVVPVTLSIHPLDFITASDNECGWSSCMSWRKSGCYSAGILEMMNSNMVLIAYIDSQDKEFIFNDYKLSNKSWRSFFYVHKQIICAGKNYPYNYDELNLAILKYLQELAKKNLGWTYQYGPERYKDLWSYRENSDIRNHSLYRYNTHGIMISTLGMYNDLVEDKDDKYYCVRNYVDKDLYLQASGPAYCLNCGSRLNKNKDGNTYDGSFETHGSRKYCGGCSLHLKCQITKKIYPPKKEEQFLFLPKYKESIESVFYYYNRYSGLSIKDRLKKTTWRVSPEAVRNSEEISRLLFDKANKVFFERHEYEYYMKSYKTYGEKFSELPYIHDENVVSGKYAIEHKLYEQTDI
jgi:hypothetical protein